ncbi:LLM class flavin-dependent oxidoreductase [Rhizobiaceae bacterium BDR2-2]|uniref:LLM class flavin-dependent oxidoreductase n=1 Tax=Ectorhizobium quercum TaxID=2965071 RepID=A0AAE3SYP0_9HYPH|nr:LLM class flavin-dependent oxidoreductase [Ectorhizobium quercum]MCX8999745.1 LLM class flavin-dependent oxidoreductase [Ectorhizobium quercum]
MKQLHLVHILGPDSLEAGADASRLRVLAGIARHLERAGFAALILPNENGPEAVRAGRPFLPCEPFTVCGALAASTRSIGLVAAVPASTSEPYNVARRLASLDHISRGRMGWNLTQAVDRFSEQYGDHSHPPRPETLERACEFTEVVEALWDSWSSEAIIVRPGGASGVDGKSNRPISHEGTFYKVKGPLDVPRPPQGHPVCFQEVKPGENPAFAARFADVVMPDIRSREEMEAFRLAFQAEADANGCPAKRVRFMPQLSVSADDGIGAVLRKITDWFQAGLVDGFCVRGPCIHLFTEEIIPQLRAQGLLDEQEVHPFLCDRLGFGKSPVRAVSP